jgi:hypothetical protein
VDNADATVAERVDGFIYALLEAFAVLDHGSAIDLGAQARAGVGTVAIGELRQ